MAKFMKIMKMAYEMFLHWWQSYSLDRGAKAHGQKSHEGEVCYRPVSSVGSISAEDQSCCKTMTTQTSQPSA